MAHGVVTASQVGAINGWRGTRSASAGSPGITVLAGRTQIVTRSRTTLRVQTDAAHRILI